jgi:hypothetical protein
VCRTRHALQIVAPSPPSSTNNIHLLAPGRQLGA